MPVDTRLLLSNLYSYRDALVRHIDALSNDFSEMERQWAGFTAVYQGEAADQFRSHWERTTQRFREYVDRTGRIQRVLQERIEYLEEYNRQSQDLA
jgi:uncharacterized protein YukE